MAEQNGGTRFVVGGGVVSSFSYTEFSNLSYEGFGGAGEIQIGGTLSTTNVNFANNTANIGGAVFNAGMLTLSGGTFLGNSAASRRGLQQQQYVAGCRRNFQRQRGQCRPRRCGQQLEWHAGHIQRDFQRQCHR